MSILHDFIVNADYTDGRALANNIKGFAIANSLKSWEMTPPVSVQPDLFKLISDRNMPVLVKRDMYDQVTSVLCYLWNPEKGYYTAMEVLPSVDQDFESLYGFTGMGEAIEDRFLRKNASRDFVFHTARRHDAKNALKYAFAEILKVDGVEECKKFDFLYTGPFVTNDVGRFITYNDSVYAFTLADPLMSLMTLTIHFTEGCKDIDFIFNTFAGAMNYFLSPEYTEVSSVQQELDIGTVSPEVGKHAAPKAPVEKQEPKVIEVMDHLSVLAKGVAAFKTALAKTRGQ